MCRYNSKKRNLLPVCSVLECCVGFCLLMCCRESVVTYLKPLTQWRKHTFCPLWTNGAEGLCAAKLKPWLLCCIRKRGRGAWGGDFKCMCIGWEEGKEKHFSHWANRVSSTSPQTGSNIKFSRVFLPHREEWTSGLHLKMLQETVRHSSSFTKAVNFTNLYLMFNYFPCKHYHS